ncbi:MAG: MFS transporter, partial [Aldersonia sp.]|nr:MFS transporter [Aldersonia sp.]
MPKTPKTVSLSRRLRPLHVSMFLQGLCLWAPVEKLFMSEIGFDPTMFGVMAATYAVVVPIMEIPSGVLADRWSRRGVLILAVLALLASVAVGALSHNVWMYLVCAMLLGVYFAMQSGTVEAIVYDAVLEHTGAGDDFERQFGRTQFYFSAALTAGSLAGGVIAALTDTRTTYALSLPGYAFAALTLLWLREPTLHRDGDRSGDASPSFAAHLMTTLRTLSGQRSLRPVVAVMVSTGVAFQVLLEFGPLWLVAFGAAAVVFGPYTAAMTATLGIGGGVAGRIRFDDTMHLAGVVAVLGACSLTLVVSGSTIVVIIAQVVLSALLVVTGIHLRRVLHDEIPSTVRAGVASGVGTLTSLVF